MTIGEWFQSAFKKFGEVSLAQGIVFAVLVLLGVGLLLLSRKQNKWSTKMLTTASLAVALSFVLGMIRLFKMPQGGSITPASMLPLMVFAYAYGTIPGLTAGMVYGVLDFLQASSPIVNVWSFTLDYIIGFGVIGLAGLFGKMKDVRLGLGIGIAVACVARFAASVASGIMFYASYAEGTGLSPFVYSITYNGSYMLPEMIICLVLGLVVGKQIVNVVKRV